MHIVNDEYAEGDMRRYDCTVTWNMNIKSNWLLERFTFTHTVNHYTAYSDAIKCALRP